MLFSSAITSGGGDCISGIVAEDPGFIDAAPADFHPSNPKVSGYGAY